MGADYLERLEIGESERSKLAMLHAGSLFDLVALAHASPEAFANYVGKDRVNDVLPVLEANLDESEKQILRQPAQKFSLGANLDPAPVIGNAGTR